MIIPDDLRDTIGDVALPVEPPRDTETAELEDFDVRLERQGSQVLVTVPSRDAEKKLREMFNTGADLDEVGSMQGFMVNEERDDGSIEMRMERSTMIQLAYQ